MSDLRIGLVAEGKTDEIIIEAAIRCILKERRFILNRIQPEIRGDEGGFGEGWGGVYRWCRNYVSQGHPSLSFDLLVIHIDADVAGMQYSDVNIKNDPNQVLPYEPPCPPAMDTVNALRSIVVGWLNHPDASYLPGNWIFCIPSKNTEAWIVAALYDPQQYSLECYPKWKTWLSQRQITQGRLKKASDYRKIEKNITAQWHQVENLCTTASRFGVEVLNAINIS